MQKVVEIENQAFPDGKLQKVCPPRHFLDEEWENTKKEKIAWRTQCVCLFHGYCAYSVRSLSLVEESLRTLPFLCQFSSQGSTHLK
jgi:hypothetical protein